MERQNRGFYLIKRSVAVQNVDWGRYLHMFQGTYRTLNRATFHRTLAYRPYRQGTFHQWTGNPPFLYRQSTALRNLFNRFNHTYVNLAEILLPFFLLGLHLLRFDLPMMI